MREFSFPSCGAGSIHCYVWEPEGEIKGVVQIVHGIAEYMPRYDDFARFLNSKGLVVVGEDHMGHGNSLAQGEVKGYFTGGWLSAVADTHTLQRKMAEEYAQLPYFLLGHSMGSFMVRTFLFTYPDAGLRGALLSGTGWQPGFALAAGKAMCRAEAKRHGLTATSERINKLMFGSYCKGIDPVRTPHDWITSVDAVVDAYEEDPLCGFDATIGLSMDMLDGLKLIEDRKNLEKMPKSLPVLFYSGDHDPVGAMGKGVEKSYRAFRAAGMENVTIKLYPGGRHEMHNEKNHTEVYADVWNWICQLL